MAHNARQMTVAEVEQVLAAANPKQETVAMLFMAEHCPQCPAAAAALDRAEQAGRVGRVLRVDADTSGELVEYAGVMATPTLHLFRGVVLDRVVTGNRVARALDQL